MAEPIYEDDYCIVWPHRPEDGRVAVQVGAPPEESRPTIVDGVALYAALERYLADADEPGRHPTSDDHRLAGALPADQPAPAPWADDDGGGA